jgi:TolB-like protein/class 3 adenylate cyclase
MASTRRLAAILAADVAGYSRLMEADEEDTHERLKTHLRQLIGPKIREHRGRVVKNTGDGLLAEFASIVDALRCAAEVQRGMIDRDLELPDERRIRFRVGVNLGDVIVEEHDIFGDGVNVAARLEALAEPGGVCISGTVRDQIRDKLHYPFEDRGEQKVKNIARPVRVYALRPEAVADLPPAGVTNVATHPRRTALIAMTAITALALVTVLAGWLWPVTKTPTPAVTAATSMAQPPITPRLSIVVLPFANLSSDPEQQYLAEGITDDLTTDLSRIAHMFVISHNTAATYASKPADTRQIGRELGVRYVLEGSVQRSEKQIRINAQLIDAKSDAHLWARRFDRELGDLFALQSEITRQIATALNLELTSREAARPADNPDALDYILRGRAVLNKGVSSENFSRAIELFEHALALSPQSIEVQSLLAETLASRVLARMSRSRSADIDRAAGLLAQIETASPGCACYHMPKGQLLRAEGRCDQAIAEFEAVIASNPNAAGAFFALGVCKIQTGSIGEAIPLEEQAIRLSPHDPAVFNRYLVIGQVHLLQSRTEEAIVWLVKARTANPASPWPHPWLASAYALKGDLERARAELVEARRLMGGGSLSSIAGMRAGNWGAPVTRALYEATYFAGLHKAGVPEE